MKCQCIKQMEEKVSEHLSEKIEGNIESVTCGNVGFIIVGNTMHVSLYVPFNVKADAPGYRSKSGKSMSMYVSFCPFCGESVRDAA